MLKYLVGLLASTLCQELSSITQLSRGDSHYSILARFWLHLVSEPSLVIDFLTRPFPHSKIATMKFTTAFATLLAVVTASPTPTRELYSNSANIAKRATISDAATLGYASQNGGYVTRNFVVTQYLQKHQANQKTISICRTTGGSGGTVTTVSTLAQFTAAVDEDDATPRIIVVSGTISGETDVRVGSNKTIVGLQGASESSYEISYLDRATCRSSVDTCRQKADAFTIAFDGVGLYLRRQSNIIIRNIISSKVPASTKGDGIRIDVSIPSQIFPKVPSKMC